MVLFDLQEFVGGRGHKDEEHAHRGEVPLVGYGDLISINLNGPGEEQTGHEERDNGLKDLVASSNRKLSSVFRFASSELSNKDGTKSSNAAHGIVSVTVPVRITRINLSCLLNVGDLIHSQKSSRDI